MGNWWTFEYDVELEDDSEDVRHDIMERIADIICNDLHDDMGGAEQHQCKRNWVGSSRPSPQMDEDTSVEVRSVVAQNGGVNG